MYRLSLSLFISFFSPPPASRSSSILRLFRISFPSFIRFAPDSRPLFSNLFLFYHFGTVCLFIILFHSHVSFSSPLALFLFYHSTFLFSSYFFILLERRQCAYQPSIPHAHILCRNARVYVYSCTASPLFTLEIKRRKKQRGAPQRRSSLMAVMVVVYR